MNVPPELTLALERLTRAETERHLAVANRNAVIAELAAQGYPKVQIARDLGVTPARVSHFLTAHKEAPSADPPVSGHDASRRFP